VVFVDEKNLSSRNLAKIMKISLGEVQELLNKHHTPTSSNKSDGSPVTELDIALSELIEEKLASSYPNFNYYSEEKFDEWKFPLIAVDPLDGTREYVAGRPEWAMSIGIFESEKWQGSGWVCNPVTKEIFEQGEKKALEKKSKYIGEVSRSEWEEGLFKKASHPNFEIKPMGSIAYKLGKLSQHKIDFVVSLRPKNIWDIAGGTLLCQESGMQFYSQGREVTKVERHYKPPLIWCAPSLFAELSQLFPS
jgi:myo-inositol-1(or 4)-monophosphatase